MTRRTIDPEVLAELGHHGPKARDREWIDGGWVTAKIRARQAEVDAAVREGLRRSPEPDLGLFGRWLGDFAGDGTPLPDNCDCFGCVGYRNILAAWRDQHLPDCAGSADIA